MILIIKNDEPSWKEVYINPEKGLYTTFYSSIIMDTKEKK